MEMLTDSCPMPELHVLASDMVVHSLLHMLLQFKVGPLPVVA